jgi:hypothetical protein
MNHWVDPVVLVPTVIELVGADAVILVIVLKFTGTTAIPAFAPWTVLLIVPPASLVP